jgi:hypothetical protein
VPSFAIDYAPLVYLFAGENYNPADIGAQLPPNTTPKINFTTVSNAPDPLTLNNLARLPSSVSLSSVGDFTNFSSQPSFLHGVKPESSGQTGDAVSCAIIVNDHASSTDPALRNVTDVFYMYFYAFDYGGDYFGFNVGNHVGDWEHTMVRFVNATPSAMWFSQHSNGEAFTYQAVEKGKDGKRVRLLFSFFFFAFAVHSAFLLVLSVLFHKQDIRRKILRRKKTPLRYITEETRTLQTHKRPGSLTHILLIQPIAYSANGTHANYAIPGIHDHTLPNINLPFPLIIPDHTSAGPLWDPTLSAYYYSYSNSTNASSSGAVGTFTPYDDDTPTDWLYFLGRWGDDKLPKSDPRQNCPFGIDALCKWTGGPTGPVTKQLERTKVCPDNGNPCILRTSKGARR